jgi:hypothetical protein
VSYPEPFLRNSCQETELYKLALIPVAALFMAAVPVNAASGCDPLVAASLKVLQVPAHLYMTQTAGYNGGRTRNAETIYLNGATFIMVNGHWRKSAVTPVDLLEAKKEYEKKAGACTTVRDEPVSGEAATLYKAHFQSPDETIDSQIWISRHRGLPLRQITDVDVGGRAGRSHTEIRYEYTNVTAPSVAEPPRK